jgi:hypothetical protein
LYNASSRRPRYLKIADVVVCVGRRACVERHDRVRARRQRLRRYFRQNSSRSDFDDDARRQNVGDVSGDVVPVVGFRLVARRLPVCLSFISVSAVDNFGLISSWANVKRLFLSVIYKFLH